MQREINKLTERLNKLEPNGKRVARRKRQKAKKTPGTASVGVSVPFRRRGGNRGGRAGDGEITISRKELFKSITTDATGKKSDYADLVPSNFNVLKHLAKSFERIKWLKCHVYYKPAVGTTKGGLITIGVDWDFSAPEATKITRLVATGFTPSSTCAIWDDMEDRKMVLPANRLMSRQWYHEISTGTSDRYDEAPGRLVYAVETSDALNSLVGEIWVEYTVVMSGTQGGG